MLGGAQLDGAGAQLVAPSDRCGARCVSGITRARLGTYARPEGLVR
ncbi:hypothetical protein ACFYN0_14555 [Streptomyces sp. NPDC006704]